MIRTDIITGKKRGETMKHSISFAGGFLLMLTAFAGEQENLFLAHANETGVPDGRKIPALSSVKIADGKLNVVFGGPGSLEYTVYITPDLGNRLYLSGSMKAANLVPGKDGWRNGRIALRFLDRSGKQAGGWPEVVSVSGTTPEKTFGRVYSIPPKAAVLLIEPAHFGKSGKVEFRSLSLTAVPENLLLAPNPGGIPEKGFVRGNFEASVKDGRLNVRIEGSGSKIIHIPVEPGWKSLKLEAKMKAKEVRKGNADWKDARIGIRFYDWKKAVGPWPDIFRMTGTTDWQECIRVYEIPEGARGLNFEPANFGVSGTVEFKDMKLSVHEYR